jgi:hypothetical protein
MIVTSSWASKTETPKSMESYSPLCFLELLGDHGLTGNDVLAVASSHGKLIVRKRDGAVLPDLSRYDDDELRQIERLNLAEWQAYWKEYLPDSGDILDFGYWNQDGSYEPPAQDWRDQCSVIAKTHSVIR